MNWELKGKEITSIKQFPEGAVGFIYILTFSDGKRYIGRKNLYTVRKKPLCKKALAQIKDKRLKKYEIIKKESDWNKYYSSNKIIKDKMKSGDLEIESREIIKVCFTEKQMTYFETQTLFCYGVLEYPEQYYNDNILGKFYKKDVINEESDN